MTRNLYKNPFTVCEIQFGFVIQPGLIFAHALHMKSKSLPTASFPQNASRFWNMTGEVDQRNENPNSAIV